MVDRRGGFELANRQIDAIISEQSPMLRMMAIDAAARRGLNPSSWRAIMQSVIRKLNIMMAKNSRSALRVSQPEYLLKLTNSVADDYVREHARRHLRTKQTHQQRIKREAATKAAKAQAQARMDEQVVREAGLRIWHPDVLEVWLTSNNSFLDGARPVDVVRLEGRARVLDALESEAAGAYS